MFGYSCSQTKTENFSTIHSLAGPEFSASVAWQCSMQPLALIGWHERHRTNQDCGSSNGNSRRRFHDYRLAQVTRKPVPLSYAHVVSPSLGGLVGLLAQECRNVVLVDTAVLKCLDGGRAVLANYRRHFVQRTVIHARYRHVVRARLLDD